VHFLTSKKALVGFVVEIIEGSFFVVVEVENEDYMKFDYFYYFSPLVSLKGVDKRKRAQE